MQNINYLVWNFKKISCIYAIIPNLVFNFLKYYSSVPRASAGLQLRFGVNNSHKMGVKLRRRLIVINTEKTRLCMQEEVSLKFNFLYLNSECMKNSQLC